MKNKVKGIILAAGMGNRLGRLTSKIPKPLLVVNNKTLISHAVDFFKNIGIEDIIVVGGYLFSKLKVEVELIDKNIKIAENTEFMFQNLLSFEKALNEIDDNCDIIVCNSDYIFQPDAEKKIAKNMKDSSIYCSFDLSGDDDDVMKVLTNKSRNLNKISKTLKKFNAIYTGVFFISSEDMLLVKKITHDLLNENKKTSIVENIFEKIVDLKRIIKVADIGKADWFEIDTPLELEKARRFFCNHLR